MAYNVAYRILGDRMPLPTPPRMPLSRPIKAMRKFRGGSFKAWVMRIVTNACYDQLRASSAAHQPPSTICPWKRTTPAYLRDPAEQPDEYVERQELNRAIQVGIHTLPLEQRMVRGTVRRAGVELPGDCRDDGTLAGHGQIAPEPGRAKLRDQLQAAKGTFACSLSS